MLCAFPLTDHARLLFCQCTELLNVVSQECGLTAADKKNILLLKKTLDQFSSVEIDHEISFELSIKSLNNPVINQIHNELIDSGLMLEPNPFIIQSWTIAIEKTSDGTPEISVYAIYSGPDDMLRSLEGTSLDDDVLDFYCRSGEKSFCSQSTNGFERFNKQVSEMSRLIKSSMEVQVSIESQPWGE